MTFNFVQLFCASQRDNCCLGGSRAISDEHPQFLVFEESCCAKLAKQGATGKSIGALSSRQCTLCICYRFFQTLAPCRRSKRNKR